MAERLFLDRRQAAGDVALGRLRIGQVRGLVPVDHVLVAVEHRHEFGPHLVVAAARGDDLSPPVSSVVSPNTSVQPAA
jgi:hypothetical protein